MSRFSTSHLSAAGLLLLTSLAIIPVKLHAETKLPASTNQLATPPLTKGAPATTTVPATSEIPVTPANGNPAVVKPTTTTTVIPAQVPTTTTVTAPIIKPVTGASIATPSKPVTSTLPVGQKPAVKPAVTAATSQPPAAESVTLTLKLKERKVYVYKGSAVLAKYPVAIGKKGWETPTGEWYVMEKITNPGWTSFKNGSVVAPGKKSPLGERWIGFWTDGKDMIGFHGTPDVKSVGKAVSSGCVRMYDKDVKALFPLVQIGTTVKVVNE